MSRRNVNHNAASLIELAKELERMAADIRAEAKRYRELKIKKPISVSGQARIDEGILAHRKFLRDVKLKIDDAHEDQEAMNR